MSGRTPDSEVKAVLGPTNTGKTHLAIDRMVAHATGMIGFPLRLLARENYDRVRRLKGERAVALITGEERIVPPEPRYFVCTVEAMPQDRRVEFLAVDEIQLAADAERGHVFTERLLGARGTRETMFLGAETIAPLLRRLVPEAEFVRRPRFSRLAYAGRTKLTRLPPRSAVIAFSAAEVYALAELMRRQRGGAAVVLGALSPRTRNAQVALYEAGEVDYLVATDAIGMGLNMAIDHVAFTALNKFDGRGHRRLSAAEVGQVAGRAGRYLNDGTFGVTGELGELEHELVGAVENHRFEPLRTLTWRNPMLDFSSLAALRRTLERPAPAPELMRVGETDDTRALAVLMRDPEIAALATSPYAVRLLWDVCGTPDYRKDMTDSHARLLGRIFRYLLSGDGVIPTDTVAQALARLDRTDGTIDALVTRIAHTRTWTYLAHRRGWLADAAGWQERARALEDKLSDALHLGLTQRFIDRRATHLARRLRERGSGLLARVAAGGEVLVEDEKAGRLAGFRFTAEPGSVRGPFIAAAERAARDVIARRLAALEAAPDDAFALDPAGGILWDGVVVARLARGPDLLRPALAIEPSDLLTSAEVERIRRRLAGWLEAHVQARLAPLFHLIEASVSGPARGLAFQLGQGGGVIPVAEAASQLRALAGADRAALARAGVRIGVASVYLPALLKPAPSRLRVLLWAAQQAIAPPAGLPDGRRPSLPQDPAHGAAALMAAGYRAVGPLAVRVDILERLLQLLRRADHRTGARLPHTLAGLLGASPPQVAFLLAAWGYSVRVEGANLVLEAAPAAPPWRRPEEVQRPGRERAGQQRREADSPFRALRRLRLSRGN